MGVSSVPDLLTALQPFRNRGQLGGLSGPGEHRWLESEDTLERGHACGGFGQGVLRVLCPHQVSTPLRLLLLTVGAKEADDLLVKTGSTVGLSGGVFSKPTRNRSPSVLLPV